MGNWANNATITKAKSIYGNFIKPEEYEKISRFKSIAELVVYLKKHGNYQEILKDVNETAIHRGNLESLLRKSSFDMNIRLMNTIFTKDRAFYKLNLILQENEIILTSLRTMISDEIDENKGRVPLFFGAHTSIDMEQVFKSTNLSELLKALVKTPYYEIIKPFETSQNMQIRYLEIEHELEEYYYEEAFKRIKKFYKGILKQNLDTIFKTRIELSNIIKIYRLKKFYQADPVMIKNVLIRKASRISENKLNELVQLKDPDAVLKVLSKSDFSQFKGEKDYVYVEYYAGRIQYNLAKRFMYHSNDLPTVFVSFMTLGEFEIDNITNIIEGIRYNVDEQEIKQMLIY